MALRRHVIEKTSFKIVEHWTADAKEELDELIAIEKINWPENVYSTSLYDFRLDATGILWHATFTRNLTRG